MESTNFATYLLVKIIYRYINKIVYIYVRQTIHSLAQGRTRLLSEEN